MLASAAAALVAAGSVAWLIFHFGGDTVTTAFDDIGSGVVAGIAALACYYAALKTSGRRRLGWRLLSASAAFWFLGEVIWSVFEVSMRQSVPVPSLSDPAYLAAIPFAAAGILQFFTPARGTSTSVRLWLDAAIVFGALLFIGWEAGLGHVSSADQPLVTRLTEVAYPLGDMLILTIVVLAIRRATVDAQGRLLLLLGGLTANAVADSSFAYLNSTASYGVLGSVFDAGWIIGYLMIALAALWPAAAAPRPAAEKPIDVWQLVLPWVAILGAGLSAIVAAVAGHPLDTFEAVLAGILAVLIMASQVYAHNESLSLLIKSNLYAATLNDIILFAPLGVLRVGADLRIIQANLRATNLLRIQAQDLVGTPLTAILPPEVVARTTDEFKALAAHAVESTESETPASRGDGTRMWLRWSATAVEKSDGTVDYFITMFNDTTARHEAEVAAATNLNVLERLNRLKSEFLTMVSHSFRTSLVGIQGFSELMRDAETLDLEEVKGFATDIYSDAQKLGEMLDKMLDLDRIGAKEISVHLVPVDLGEAIRKAVASATASDVRRTITADIEPDLPLVAGDTGRLEQVIAILLSNAVKYSADGSEINVSGRSEAGQVVISVKDHGIGMPSDFDASLFARYQWSANNPTAKVMGTGLGLPMARQIVEMHTGRIWFESKVGSGSEFHFSIPLQADGAGPHEQNVNGPVVAAPR